MIELLVLLCSVLVFLYWKSRRVSTPVRLPVHSNLREGRFDFVVVGAGAGGLSATKEILTMSPKSTVLLIESGPDSTPQGVFKNWLTPLSTFRLLSFYPDKVFIPGGALPGTASGRPGSRFMRRLVARRPLRHGWTEENNNTTAVVSCAAHQRKEELAQYTPYPKGLGIGGTSLVDWSIPLKSVLGPGTDSTPLCTNLPKYFSPLSQTFSETVKMHLKEEEFSGFECPVPLYLHQDGRKANLTALLSDLTEEQLSRLTVVVSTKVKGFDTEEKNGKQVVKAVQCVADGQSFSFEVAQGVVLAAGAVNSPRILATLSLPIERPPTPPCLFARDAIGLPLLFKCYNGISFDRVNTRTLQSLFTWVFADKGLLLHPISDCMGRMEVSSSAGRAHVKLLFLPFGGRDAPLFYSMGWDRSVASFQEAFTVLVVLEELDCLKVRLDTEVSSRAGEWSQVHGATPLRCAADSVFSEESASEILEIFRSAVRKVRDIVQQPPLSFLSFGSEAVDFTLLEEDPNKALRLAKLAHTPLKKYSRQMKEDVEELSSWAHGITKKDSYLNRYIRNHAYWLGFSSGSSEPFLSTDEGDSSQVRGLGNMTVGDTSAVTERMWRESGKETLFAASVGTAVDAGKKAGLTLLQLVE